MSLDGSLGFYVDQLKELSPTFRPDAVVNLGAKFKPWFPKAFYSWRWLENMVAMSVKVVSFKLVYKEPPSSIIFEPAENCSFHVVRCFAQRTNYGSMKLSYIIYNIHIPRVQWNLNNPVTNRPVVLSYIKEVAVLQITSPNGFITEYNVKYIIIVSCITIQVCILNQRTWFTHKKNVWMQILLDFMDADLTSRNYRSYVYLE